MNRRNFILGLGTAATLSGAASVTGASISGTADAGANFNVIAENNLTIRRNSAFSTAGNGEILNSTSDNYVNSTVNYVDSEGTINETIGSGIEDVGGPRLTVNEQENSQLSMALATQNDATIEDNLNSTTGTAASPYSDTNGTAPLEIANNGGQNKTISASYTYGDDVGNGSLTQSDVAQLFTFSINDNADVNNAGQISPGTDAAGSSGDQSTNTYQAEITSGGSATVDFTINYNSSLVDKIESAASGGSDYDFSTSGFANVDLLQTVSFGEVDGT